MRGLPESSNLRRAVDPDPWPGWNLERELLAQLVELTSAGLARRGLRAPVTIPRPPQQRRRHERPRRSTPAELGAFFGAAVRVVPTP